MADLETLYRRFMDQSCTQQEKETLFAMILQEENDPRLLQIMDQMMKEEQEEIRVEDTRADEMLTGLLGTLPREKKRSKLVTLSKWAAAAVVMAGAGMLFFLQRSSRPATSHQQASSITQDLPPAAHGAILTLGDGRKVTLDSLQKGVIANQGGTSVSLAAGTISYDDQRAATISYNTLSTPRGRLFRLVLPDGSDVWLNAASSITYPTSFTGTDRTVTLQGEAYFDVKQDAQRPFMVKMANNTEVRVLGTAFNINAYDNEHAITTTLINGSVQINAGQSRILKPGDQASVHYNAAGIQVNRADTSQVLAWKNGVFNFENADIQTVMKQLERWYDIEAIYENGVPMLTFGGKMDRNLSLSNIIRMLEISDVHCRLEGKKLIIRQ